MEAVHWVLFTILLCLFGAMLVLWIRAERIALTRYTLLNGAAADLDEKAKQAIACNIELKGATDVIRGAIGVPTGRV